jgi:hypothetical protein
MGFSGGTPLFAKPFQPIDPIGFQALSKSGGSFLSHPTANNIDAASTLIIEANLFFISSL